MHDMQTLLCWTNDHASEAYGVTEVFYALPLAISFMGKTCTSLTVVAAKPQLVFLPVGNQ